MTGLHKGLIIRSIANKVAMMGLNIWPKLPDFDLSVQGPYTLNIFAHNIAIKR